MTVRRAASVLPLAVAALLAGCGSSAAPSGGAAAGSGAAATSGGSAPGSHLTITGTIAGRVDGSRPGSFCDVSGQVSDLSGRTLTATWTGSLNGAPYDFGITLSFYTGPGSYAPAPQKDPVDFTMGKEAAPSLSVSSGATYTYSGSTIDFRSLHGSVTVNADEKSGTLDVALKAGEGLDTTAPEVAHVTGTWSCAPQP